MKRIALTLVASAALVGIVITGASANNISLTGDRLNVLNPTPTTFLANTPFHITNGLFCDASEIAAGCLNAGTHFDVYLDGVRQKSQVDIDVLSKDPLVKSKFNYTNYPAGLPAGTYTFTSDFFFEGANVGNFFRTVTFG